MAGYEWFLTNVVNNGNGGWPLALGSDRFVEDDFDVAEVAGIFLIFLIGQKSSFESHLYSFLNIDVSFNFCLGMGRRQYAEAMIIAGAVYQDIKDTSQNVIYVR